MKKIVSASVVALFFLVGIMNAQTAHKGPPPKPLTLKQSLAVSPLVVVGEVIAVNPASLGRKYISEHDPNWQIATVKVVRPLKPYRPIRGITEVYVVFAGSRDIAWFRSPKLTVGQKAIFILTEWTGPPSPEGKELWSIQHTAPSTKSNIKKIERLLRAK
ncbi:MAG: hypothetical protein Q7R94_00415 [bacterium]|nr:hypothetical protein [bacterium]